jgi:hypothetical protein
MRLATPPPGAATMLEELRKGGPNATPRENYELFVTDPNLLGCSVCHQQFQPVGLAFENFDEVGHYRTQYETGTPVDPSGELVNGGDAAGPFVDAVDLVNKIAASTTGQYCFTKRYMSFASGRPINAGEEACTIKKVGDPFIQSGTRVQDLAVAFTQTDGFYRRIYQ